MSFAYTLETHTYGEPPKSEQVENVEAAFDKLKAKANQPYAAWLRIKSFDYVWTLDMKSCRYEPNANAIENDSHLAGRSFAERNQR